MKKIPTLFERDWDGDRSRVTREVNPECRWVIDGEGRATQKFDGTAVLNQDGTLFKRYEVKAGRTPPAGFVPAQEPDATTGDVPGWVPASRDNPADRWLWEAHDAGFFDRQGGRLSDGTYELVGPKVQGNPDGITRHRLLRHGDTDLDWRDGGMERTYDGIRAYLEAYPMEGIVWHHPDGRMAKIKRRDFGLPWPVRT